MRPIWHSLRKHQAKESRDPKSPFERETIQNPISERVSAVHGATAKAVDSGHQRGSKFKLVRLPGRQLKVDVSKGLLMLVSALEANSASSPVSSTLVLRRGHNVAFLSSKEKNESRGVAEATDGCSLLGVLDSHQPDSAQAHTVIDGSPPVDSGLTLISPEIRALPPRTIDFGKLGRMVGGGKKGRRSKYRVKGIKASPDDPLEPVPRNGAGSLIHDHTLAPSHTLSDFAFDELTSRLVEGYAAEERADLRYPLSVSADAVRFGPPPRCSLSEPDLATIEYTSGWLGDDHAIRVASVLSEKFSDERSKDNQDIAIEEFSSLLGHGDRYLEVLQIAERVKEMDACAARSASESSLSGVWPHTMGRQPQRMNSAGDIIWQLEDVAEDYGDAYEEMEQRISVCSVVGGAVLRGVVRALTEESAEALNSASTELAEMKAEMERKNERIADLLDKMHQKEAETATLIREFQFQQSTFVSDLLREKEVVLQMAREKESCVSTKEKELTELAGNLVHVSLQLDGETKKVALLEKQMNDLRNAQAAKIREIANLIEETNRMKCDNEEALDEVKRESRLRELRVKETLDRLLKEKEVEVRDLSKQRTEHLEKINSMEALERTLRQELSMSNKIVAALENSLQESLTCFDCVVIEKHELTAKLRELFKQFGQREQYVILLEEQVWTGSEERSIILELWRGKMADVQAAMQVISTKAEEDKINWAGKLSVQSQLREDTLQELNNLQVLNGGLQGKVHNLEHEIALQKDSLENQMRDLDQKYLDQSKCLEATSAELLSEKQAKSIMEQELHELRLEVGSLREQVDLQSKERELGDNAWGDKLTFQLQENALNVQELERLQDVNCNMAKELLEIKLHASLLKHQLDRQTEELDEVRRCWADDKSNQSSLLEDNRRELTSLRHMRETLEADVRNLKLENDALKENLESQLKAWKDEKARWSKDSATYEELVEEKSMALIASRFDVDALQQQVAKFEEERLLSADQIEEERRTSQEISAELQKLEASFGAFVQNTNGIHQNAFQHARHLEAVEEQMLSHLWRLEMELDIISTVFGSSSENILRQADEIAVDHALTAEHLSFCLSELERTKTVLCSQAVDIEDVQTANAKLSEFSDQLCSEIESCTEEISRCKIALSEATSRAERSKGEFITLQQKMANIRLKLEESLHDKVAEVLRLKDELKTVYLEARESEWKYESESSLVLHVVDAWRKNMEESFSWYGDQVSLREERKSILTGQLNARPSPELGFPALASYRDEYQTLQDERWDTQWKHKIEQEISSVIYEDKFYELARLLDESTSKLVDTASMLSKEAVSLEIQSPASAPRSSRASRMESRDKFREQQVLIAQEEVEASAGAIAEESPKELSPVAVAGSSEATQKSPTLYHRVFDHNTDTRVLEGDVRLELGRDETSMTGVEDEAGLKVLNKALVDDLKAKMYEWSREKDMLIAEKTEQLYTLKRELLKEKEKERGEIISKKEREVEAMRNELRKVEASVREQANCEHDKVLSRLTDEWDRERSRLLELLEKGKDREDLNILELTEEYHNAKADLQGTIAAKEVKIQALAAELSVAKMNEERFQARVGELAEEVARLAKEISEGSIWHHDELEGVQADLEAKESALQVANERLLIEQRQKAGLEADLERVQAAVDELDEALCRVTGEFQEEKANREKLLSDVQACKYEMAVLNGRSVAERREVEYHLTAQLQKLDKKYQMLESVVAGKIQQQNFRLEGAHKEVKLVQGELASLLSKEEDYRRKILKQQRNLQTAEEEVDLLGDEVESLLTLVERVDSVLEHYSPVLKHYPGMADLVQLVRETVLQRMDSTFTKQVR